MVKWGLKTEGGVGIFNPPIHNRIGLSPRS